MLEIKVENDKKQKTLVLQTKQVHSAIFAVDNSVKRFVRHKPLYVVVNMKIKVNNFDIKITRKYMGLI